MSDKIRPNHLARKAILYVRQSSAYQVSHNLESQRLQYAMRDRLQQLGWREIDVVDEDLGRSAAGLVTRSGFERMVADVCLGKVGAVAAREVSRFARNSREWQQLVEVCRVVDTVLIDQDTVYAPRLSNDRLLLGLKGSLNEYELDLLRQRSVEARRQKAKRGELLIVSPVGYRKGEQRLEKDPDRRVQEAIDLVFRKLLELGSVRQTLLWFHRAGTRTAGDQSHARRCAGGGPPTAWCYSMLTNPAYGGAYAYGKTEQVTALRRRRTAPVHSAQAARAVAGVHPRGPRGLRQLGTVRARASRRSPRTRSGAATSGPRSAGRRCWPACCTAGGAVISCLSDYTGNAGTMSLRYHCRRGWLDNGEPRCIGFAGLAVDQAVSKEILRVVQPAAIEAARLATPSSHANSTKSPPRCSAISQAARYSAQRAQKQFDQADPDNRLVADELERRWNQALGRVREVEAQIEQHQQSTGSARLRRQREDFRELAADLEAVWNDEQTDARLKKRILRSLDPRHHRRRRSTRPPRWSWSSTGRVACTPSCACRGDAADRTPRTRRGRPSKPCACWRTSAPINRSPAFSTATACSPDGAIAGRKSA